MIPLHSNNALALREVHQELDALAVVIEAHAFSLRPLANIAPLVDVKSIDRVALDSVYHAICIIQAQLSAIDAATDGLFGSLESTGGLVTIQRQPPQATKVCIRQLSAQDQQLQAGDAGAMVTGCKSAPGGT